MSDTKTIKYGDKFTTEGFGKGQRRYLVVKGKSVNAGQKMRINALFEFRCDFRGLEKRIKSHYNTDSPL